MYPTETMPAPGPGPARRRGCRTAALFGLAILAGVLLGGCIAFVVNVGKAGDQARRSRQAERADVAAPTCTVDGLGFMRGTMAVTNHSSKRSNYVVEVTFEGPDGGQLSTAHALVSALEPGQSTRTTAQTFTKPAAGRGFTCRIVKLDRTSDVG